MVTAVAGSGPKSDIISAVVPRKVRKRVDAVAHDAGFSRSEAAELLILAGLAVLAVLATSREAARVLGDEKKVKRYAPRALKKSLELIQVAQRGE